MRNGNVLRPRERMETNGRNGLCGAPKCRNHVILQDATGFARSPQHGIRIDTHARPGWRFLQPDDLTQGEFGCLTILFLCIAASPGLMQKTTLRACDPGTQPITFRVVQKDLHLRVSNQPLSAAPRRRHEEVKVEREPEAAAYTVNCWCCFVAAGCR